MTVKQRHYFSQESGEKKKTQPNSGGCMNQIIFIKLQDFRAEEIDGNSTKYTFSALVQCVKGFKSA